MVAEAVGQGKAGADLKAGPSNVRRRSVPD